MSMNEGRPAHDTSLQHAITQNKATPKVEHLRQQATNIAPDNLCALLQLPAEIIDEIVSSLFLLLPNGRPERRIQIYKPLAAPTQKPSALAILLTCRQLYQIAHNKAYRNIEWDLQQVPYPGPESGTLEKTYYHSIIPRNLSHQTLSNLQFLRGDRSSFRRFLSIRNVFFQEIELEKLKLVVLGAYEPWCGDCPASADYAFDTCCLILRKWRKLKGLDLLPGKPYNIGPPQKHFLLDGMMPWLGGLRNDPEFEVTWCIDEVPRMCLTLRRREQALPDTFTGTPEELKLSRKVENIQHMALDRKWGTW